jgi:hypothetical protein
MSGTATISVQFAELSGKNFPSRELNLQTPPMEELE